MLRKSGLRELAFGVVLLISLALISCFVGTREDVVLTYKPIAALVTFVGCGVFLSLRGLFRWAGGGRGEGPLSEV